MGTKPSMSINLGLPAIPETQDPDLYAALIPLYSAIRNVMYAVDGYTGNAYIDPADYSEVNPYAYLGIQRQSIIFLRAYEDMSAGTIACIWDSAGKPVMRRALGGVYRAHGFLPESVKAGAYAPLALAGLCSGIGSMSIGSSYWLSDVTAGLITPTPPATPGNVQRLGFAIDTNKLFFQPE